MMTREDLVRRIKTELKQYDPNYVEIMQEAWGEDLERADGRLVADAFSYLLGRRQTQHLRRQD